MLFIAIFTFSFVFVLNLRFFVTTFVIENLDLNLKQTKKVKRHIVPHDNTRQLVA